MKKYKRTVFSKIFINNIICVIVALFILTFVEGTLISDLMSKNTEKQLKNDAKMIENLLTNNVGSIEHLSMFLTGFSRSTNRDIIIVDRNCNVIMHSVVTERFNNNIRKIPEQYCKKVLSNKEEIIRGTMNGVFKQNMFTLQIPVVDVNDNDFVLGAIMISMPFPETRRLESQIINILLMSAILVIFLTFILSYTLAKRISTPIRQVNSSVKKFAKRNFEERIILDKNKHQIEEISELAKTFNNMADEIEKSDNVKNNFISDVSHELRTPMTTISGFVDGILDDTIPKERQKDYLKIVRDEMSRLIKLVNDFLDVTRFNNNFSLKYKDFDIAEMIRQSIVAFENELEEKRINVELNFEYNSVFVNADFDSIKRVITNLIDNAVKFTDEDGEIIITIESEKQEVKVSVYNSGCGVSKDDIPYIFNRFYKVDKSRSVNKGGTGIGLFIVKDILTRHGKNIILESEENKFAKFIFRLNSSKISINS